MAYLNNKTLALGQVDLPESLYPALDQAETVLLDVGGVLASDAWQWVILTPEVGLADRLGIDREEAERVGQQLWKRYSLISSTSEEYWGDFSAALGIPTPSAELVAEVEARLILPSPVATVLFEMLHTRGLRVGIISDNTAFWYPRQAELLNFDDHIDPCIVFLSYVHHRNKKADVSLFEVAARSTDPSRTVVIDDRDHNIARAASFGFAGVQVQGIGLPT